MLDDIALQARDPQASQHRQPEFHEFAWNTNFLWMQHDATRHAHIACVPKYALLKIRESVPTARARLG